MGTFYHGVRRLLADHAGPTGAALGALARDLGESADEPPLRGGRLAAYICVCVGLVVFSGLMAGLTLGLLSLDKMELEVLRRSGSDRERRLVARIEPLVAKPHFLLATLLLCNSAAMEALPLFLDRLLNPVAAIVISVTAILAFGEIIPQALCKRYGLEVGAACAGLVRALMLATSAITWPVGELLDLALGEHTVLFRRAQLRALVELHGGPRASAAPAGGPFLHTLPWGNPGAAGGAQGGAGAAAAGPFFAGGPPNGAEGAAHAGAGAGSASQQRLLRPQDGSGAFHPYAGANGSSSYALPRSGSFGGASLPGGATAPLPGGVPRGDASDAGGSGDGSRRGSPRADSPPPITSDEVRIIAGALDMASKTATAAMTPLEAVLALPEDALLDRETLRLLVDRGHSRVPVCAAGCADAFVGVLLVKDILTAAAMAPGSPWGVDDDRDGPEEERAPVSGDDAEQGRAPDRRDAAEQGNAPASCDGAEDDQARAAPGGGGEGAKDAAEGPAGGNRRPSAGRVQGGVPPALPASRRGRAAPRRRPAGVPRVCDMRIRPLPAVAEDTPLYEVLRLFQEGRSHLAAVVAGRWADGVGGTIRWTGPGGGLGVAGSAAQRALQSRAARRASATGAGGGAAIAAPGMPGAPTAPVAPSPLALPPSPGGHPRSLSSFSSPHASLQPFAPPFPQPAGAPGAAAPPTPLGAMPGDDLGVAAAPPGPPRLRVLGIITIEDVIEELLQQEFVDETDEYVDNLRTVRVDVLRGLAQLPQPGVPGGLAALHHPGYGPPAQAFAPAPGYGPPAQAFAHAPGYGPPAQAFAHAPGYGPPAQAFAHAPPPGAGALASSPRAAVAPQPVPLPTASGGLVPLGAAAPGAFAVPGRAPRSGYASIPVREEGLPGHLLIPSTTTPPISRRSSASGSGKDAAGGAAETPRELLSFAPEAPEAPPPASDAPDAPLLATSSPPSSSFSARKSRSASSSHVALAVRGGGDAKERKQEAGADADESQALTGGGPGPSDRG